METLGEITDKERGHTSFSCGEKRQQSPNLIPLNAVGQRDTKCAGEQGEPH